MDICESFATESYAERLERYLSWKDHRPSFLAGRRKTHKDNVVIVRKRFFNDSHKWEYLRDLYTDNLVTDAGDQFYAEGGTRGNVAFTIDFGNASARMELGDGTQPTPTKGNTYSAMVGPIIASRKALNATYPKTSDTDPDNIGAANDIVTWLTSWLTTDFNDTNITGGVIHDAGATPVSGSLLLTFWTIAAFSKSSTDTLKIFVNHELRGI